VSDTTGAPNCSLQPMGEHRGYPKGEADLTSPEPLQAAVLDPVLISRRDFLLATRTHMELDGCPVGSQVYLEKWSSPGLGRAIPDLGAQAAQAAAISTGRWRDMRKTRGYCTACPTATGTSGLLSPFQLNTLACHRAHILRPPPCHQRCSGPCLAAWSVGRPQFLG
jgi:hypothetical protein